jgi:hypothetical protein
MSTTLPTDKTPIPVGKIASGRMDPTKATSKKLKDTDPTSYPLEVCVNISPMSVH